MAVFQQCPWRYMAYPPLFSTSLPRSLNLQASNPQTYALCVILIDRVSPRMEGWETVQQMLHVEP